MKYKQTLELASVALAMSTAFALPASAGTLQRSSYLLAQASGSCRRVTAQNALNIRSEPTLDSRVVGTISFGRNVTIKNQGASGWVPVSVPVEGYVFANYLTSCSNVQPPIDSCRRAKANIGGLPVRRSPASDAAVLGTVASGRRLTIVNRGDNGWVPVNVPLNGYVEAQYLTYCAN